MQDPVIVTKLAAIYKTQADDGLSRPISSFFNKVSDQTFWLTARAPFFSILDSGSLFWSLLHIFMLVFGFALKIFEVRVLTLTLERR